MERASKESVAVTIVSTNVQECGKYDDLFSNAVTVLYLIAKCNGLGRNLISGVLEIMLGYADTSVYRNAFDIYREVLFDRIACGTPYRCTHADSSRTLSEWSTWSIECCTGALESNPDKFAEIPN